MIGRPARPGHRSGGQATVELALGLPAVLLGVLLVLQLTLVGRDRLLLAHATREAARAAATDPRAGAAREGALHATTGLDPDRLEVHFDRHGGPTHGRVEVRLRYHARTTLPLVGVLVPDPVLHDEATMLEEPRD